MNHIKNQLTIIIVNWNAGTQLADVILSVINFHFGLVAEVVVVDNASTDASLSLLCQLPELPFSLRIIQNEENMGFGAACNQGAVLSQSKYLLFLNPDCRLYENSLSSVFEYMECEKNKLVGICGIKLFDESGEAARSTTAFPLFHSLIFHTIGVTRFFPKLGYFSHEWDHCESRTVDHLIGAFYFVRKELFVQLNGFDEQFFVYLEDLDFSYRAAQLGYSSYYLADASAFHAGGGTSSQVKAHRLYYSVRSRLLYTFKHLKFFPALCVLLVTLFIEPVSRTIQAILNGSISSFLETWRGFFMLYRWLPRWLIKGEIR